MECASQEPDVTDRVANEVAQAVGRGDGAIEIEGSDNSTDRHGQLRDVASHG
ncbi:hypothetical protein BN2476_930048 [Paraburkholderia piptadeniae]|uniref:Uncharacterized protein n=1 Tax=Paraburkholderia piptadeniae TaxID=1701573 RepID=A0A1N7STP7_9BURK|nr:hypothetical protein BN2476_930048 [Paraburkholderia piptadeniae]